MPGRPGEAVFEAAYEQLLEKYKPPMQRYASFDEHPWMTDHHAASIVVDRSLKAVIRQNQIDGTWAVGWEAKPWGFVQPDWSLSGYGSKEEAEAALPEAVERYRTIFRKPRCLN